MTSTPGHYFSAQPQSESRPQTVHLDLHDLKADLVTDRGVFSPTRVDAGTRILLEYGPQVVRGENVIDVGCGYGAISVALAHRSPRTTVWAVDVNQRALALCATNAARLGLTNVRVSLAADVPEDLRFDAIWSNPPIRIGKPALHQLLSTWLPRLEPGASAVLVVHKQLGSDSLARWLEAGGWTVERLLSRSGYRVLRVAASSVPGTPSP